MQQTFGKRIAALRKEQGMTQLELAGKMGVTDKAVSKWERDLSFPDVCLLPRLAEIFHVTVDELMQARAMHKEMPQSSGIPAFAALVWKCIALAMGIAVAVLTLMQEIETHSALVMLGLGLACLAAAQLPGNK